MNEDVLIIDDVSAVVESLQDHLTEVGITSRGETDYEKAIESFQSDPTDVVIVDYLLTSVAGITALDVVKELSLIKPFTRFIMISGWMPSEITEEYIAKKLEGNIKIDRYFPKPYRVNEVVTAIKELLRDVSEDAADWKNIAQAYVSAGSMSVEKVREVNDEFKSAIIKASEKEGDE